MTLVICDCCANPPALAGGSSVSLRLNFGFGSIAAGHEQRQTGSRILS